MITLHYACKTQDIGDSSHRRDVIECAFWEDLSSTLVLMTQRREIRAWRLVEKLWQEPGEAGAGLWVCLPEGQGDTGAEEVVGERRRQLWENFSGKRCRYNGMRRTGSFEKGI